MKHLFYLILTALVTTLPIAAQDDLVTKIDELVSQSYNMDLFSGTVTVAENGKPIYQKAIGYADIENKVPNKMNTAFNFGSIGKMFTGAAILKLAEEEKLNLDDNIDKYINYFPEEIAKKITIRHLLKHEAGLGDYLNNPKFRQNVNSYRSLNDLMNLIKDEQLLFEPGTSNRYSNSGYATLGAVIESVTGKSFYVAIDNLILEPLGLQHTYYSTVNQVRDKVVKYFRTMEGTIMRTPFQDWPSPAGGEYSTTDDLLKFVQGLFYSNKVLSDESKALFINRFDENRKSTWQDILNDERFVPFWAGGAPGLNAAIVQYLKRNITVTILTNFGPPFAINLGNQIKSIIDTGNYLPIQIPLEEKIYKTYIENGVDYVETNFKQLIAGYRLMGTEDLIINQIGYTLISMGKIDDAIKLFTVNTKLFPEVANVFDSLAEAYMNNGNKEKAVENYKKVLELEPNSATASQSLKRLEEKQ